MHFSLLILSCLLCCSLSNLAMTNSERFEDLLETVIQALQKGLQYMEDNVMEINLDGAFGCRLVEVLLHAFLKSSPRTFDELGDDVRIKLEMLASKAGRVVDGAIPYLKTEDPVYSKALGGLLAESNVTMWYPSRDTVSSLQVQPLPCSVARFNGTFSDICLKEILEKRTDGIDRCKFSRKCLDFMTRPGTRGYMLTHQILYLQFVEMRGCLKKLGMKFIPRLLQDTLCSNVMRDSQETASSGYPLSHQDLFMEQIGLCGLWGYRDFFREDWLKEILLWQEESGCYAKGAPWFCTENLAEKLMRSKREEKILQDGCLSHKTTVALAALAANVRFIAEKISDNDIFISYYK